MQINTAGCKKVSYDKDTGKSHADTVTCKKASYDKDLEKSHVGNATSSKVSYGKDPESGIKSAARSKASNDKDIVYKDPALEEVTIIDCKSRSLATEVKSLIEVPTCFETLLVPIHLNEHEYLVKLK